MFFCISFMTPKLDSCTRSERSVVRPFEELDQNRNGSWPTSRSVCRINYDAPRNANDTVWP